MRLILLLTLILAVLSVVSAYGMRTHILAKRVAASSPSSVSVQSSSSRSSRSRWNQHGWRCACSQCARSFALKSNKLDGVVISGDLTPLSNNLLVKVKEAMAETKGGLFIPDNAKERPTEGQVIAAGPGRVHPDTGVQLDIAVNVGSSVIYGKYDGTELKYNDLPHQLIKDDDVLLKYTGTEATFANVECVKDQVLVKLPPKKKPRLQALLLLHPWKDKVPRGLTMV